MKHVQNKAFTLSEVLVSLVIIGVIAAITVPVIFANYQEQALKSSLKKNYSVLKQALDRYQAENGERVIASDIAMTSDYNNEQLINVFIPYLNILYDCGETRANSSCIPIDAYSGNGNSSDVYKTYNGYDIMEKRFDDGQFVLSDGSLLLFEGISITNNIHYISVDVNGFGKKPNRLGKDLFVFELNDDGNLLPEGAKGTVYYDTDSYCSNTSTDSMNGAGCTYKALLN